MSYCEIESYFPDQFMPNFCANPYLRSELHIKFKQSKNEAN